MEIRLQKWGNSLGIRIPSSILKTLNLKQGDKIIINTEEEKIIITKSKNPKISLAERFKNYHGKNLSKSFTWDENQGREIW
ncbi:MAG: AbrB/MazE/SpoVT family DNA-binding domain-containing protein [Bacilli bacterium]|nr:AbrB/MazE/SpoVT family DNA-binding domain-containing protein [Bacilli bacterium]